MANANRQRGEIKVEGPEGVGYRLCLTLGAIAEIEEGLKVESLTQIDEVMKKARMRDIITVFLALLHGGGHEGIERGDMMRWQLPLLDLMGKIQETFAAAGFSDKEEAPDTPGN